MTITAITIENFKSIKEPVRVEFKPITLLFGPNSSGKSTIIQALHYAYELLVRGNVDPTRTFLGGDVIDLGGFANFVNAHDKTKTIILSFELDLSEDDLYEYVDWLDEESLADVAVDPNEISTATVTIHIDWLDGQQRPLVSKCNISINGELFAEIESSTDGKQVFTQYFNLQNLLFHEFDSQGEMLNIITETEKSADTLEHEKFLGEEYSPSPLLHAMLLILSNHSSFQMAGKQLTPLLNSNQRFEVSHFDGLEEISNEVKVLNFLMIAPCEYLRNLLHKILYVGPLRDVPARNFTPDKFPAAYRWSNGLAAWDYLYSATPATLKKINHWLTDEQRLNCGYSAKIKEYMEIEWTDKTAFEDTLADHFLNFDLETNEEIDAQGVNLPSKKRLYLWDEQAGIEVSPQDIGVGISQVLPVIVSAIKTREGMILIEQPELHVHPALQVSLGDLFIEQVTNNPNVTFILETHSEHLLLRFLRRIRETYENELPSGALGLSPDDMSICYIEKIDKQVKVSNLKISEDGDSANKWPDGFFEERHGELY